MDAPRKRAEPAGVQTPALGRRRGIGTGLDGGGGYVGIL